MHTKLNSTSSRRAPGVTAGLTLLALGAAALVGTVFDHPLDSLWSVVLFLPAAAALLNAWRTARSSGSVTPVAVRYAVSGALLSLLGVTVLLHLSWDVMRPLMVMLLGTAALTGVRRRHLR